MALCRNPPCKTILYVLILISAWHHLNNGELAILLPAAAGQQLQESMAVGTSWAAQDLYYLCSPSKAFCFGWLQFPSVSLKFYVAVWYGGLDGSVVWVANRNTPAAANDTLQITSDGNVVLISASRPSPFWQTNTTSKEVSSLQILDSGNAVLLYKNSSFAWQSFSSPTDTLLPSQSFLVNSTLVSRLHAASLASGSFKFYIQDSRAYIDYIFTSTGTSIASIWRARDAIHVVVDAVNNSAIAAQFLMNGIFSMYNLQNGSVYSQFVPSDYRDSAPPNTSGEVFRRLTLDPDGDLRMYGWDYTLNSWIVLSKAMYKFCFVMAQARVPTCGPYGVCLDGPKTACACPPGFYPTDLNDVSKGCSPSNLPLPTCQGNISSISSSLTTYRVLTDTNFYEHDMVIKGATSLAECQRLCTSFCSCLGLVYDNRGAATCFLKSSLVYGYSGSLEGSRDTYIKIQNSTSLPVINPLAQSPTLSWINSSSYWSQGSLQLNCSNYCGSSVVTNCSICPTSHQYITKSTSRLMVIVVSLVEFVLFLVALLIIWKTNACRHGQKASLTQHAVCRAFTYEELDEATDHFKYPLGSGAFGVVFKGVLPEGTEIAVKRLQTNVMQIADTQFRAEISTLGRIHHMNLLRLYGFCADGLDHRLLVYEFMANGSLNKALFEEGDKRTDRQDATTEGSDNTRRRSLDWKTRYSICLGTAKGLAYLHEDCLDCIVHCDIKPENILLDQEFHPRVADFGLAYLFGRNETVQVSNVRGTRGYLAPEWVTYRPVTAKADVFSYGMVLIEIVTGRRNFRFTPSAIDDGRWDHPKWAFQQVQSGWLDKVVDQSIRSQVVADDTVYSEVERVLNIAFLCLHRDANARPTMKNIVQMLEFSISVPALPGGPGSFQEQAENLDYDDEQFLQGPHFCDASSTATGTNTTLSAR